MAEESRKRLRDKDGESCKEKNLMKSAALIDSRLTPLLGSLPVADRQVNSKDNLE